MRGETNFTPRQQKTFEDLMRADSNWPPELRDRFEERRTQIDGFQPNLDRDVVVDYVQEVIK